MSCDLQDKSPAQQREHILSLAARMRCSIIRWYHDLGISGDDAKRRTAFRQMIADAVTKSDFSQILCWSQDRFGRFDSLEAGEWVGPLRRAGVRLVTVAEGAINWEDTTGRLIYTIQQEAKNTFLIDYARNATRGRFHGAQKLGSYAGRLPYGYDKLIFDELGNLQRHLTRADRFRKPSNWTARLELSADRKSVAAVRAMFRSYAAGMTIRAITARINKAKIPAPMGRYWRIMTVRNILRNPVYTGDQVWNRRHVGKYFGIMNGEVTGDSVFVQRDGERRGVSKNLKADWVIVKNAHPAVVSRKLFDQVQRRLEERKGRNYQRRGLGLIPISFAILSNYWFAG
jgi:DNA invertase Pin-like site-specific DNA recombinase